MGMGDAVERPIKTKQEIEQEIERMKVIINSELPHSFGIMTKSEKDELMAAKSALEWVLR